jgi:hypothetical protein
LAAVVERARNCASAARRLPIVAVTGPVGEPMERLLPR